jgi:signal transduction histidine kinase
MEGTLPPEELFQTLVDTVAGALKVPWVALELSDAGSLAPTTVSETGKRAARATTMKIERFPLVHQGVALGALVVGARAEGESLTAADRQVLESIAAQASPAIQAAQLNVRLQQSRQAIVAAREEERRRLRRDLHDGLGPLLASQTLTIDAILRMQGTDPAQTRTLLLDLKQQSQDAIRDIRRIVYDLRPPALDDLGLIEALRESAARTEQAGIPVTFAAPKSLPALPAAIESSAWYIAREGLANAVRHAKATSVTLQVSVEEEMLLIQIRDNGIGVSPDARAGVGLLSMRERAMEVGGDLTVEKIATGGTGIAARLPIVFNTSMLGAGNA